MARRRQPAGRKRRTREHVVADLGVNFVERVVLECGYAVERKRADYGIDLLIDTFDRRGEIETGQIQIQVKATDTLARTADGRTVTRRVAVADLRAWVFEIGPVVLVVYDARADTAYWLDVQEYARAAGLELDTTRTVSLRMPVLNVWDRNAVRQLRMTKNRLAERARRATDDD